MYHPTLARRQRTIFFFPFREHEPSSIGVIEVLEVVCKRFGHKKEPHFRKALCLIWRLPTFPLGVAVSSATQGLTSLFEMVKGVHLLYNHQKYL